MNSIEKNPRRGIEEDILNFEGTGPFGSTHRQWPLNADITPDGIHQEGSDI